MLSTSVYVQEHNLPVKGKCSIKNLPFIPLNRIGGVMVSTRLEWSVISQKRLLPNGYQIFSVNIFYRPGVSK
jgi:hypothetical protein